MFSTIKAYLVAGAIGIVSIFFVIFSSTRKENKLLKQVNKDQTESLRIIDTKEEVTSQVTVEHNVKEASLEASNAVVKERVKNETTSNNDTLDPEFIRMLNNNRN